VLFFCFLLVQVCISATRSVLRATPCPPWHPQNCICLLGRFLLLFARRSLHHSNIGVFWGPHHAPLNTPKIVSACSEGCRLSIWRVVTWRNASCGVFGGHFRRRRPWLWQSLCVFFSLPEHEPLLSGGTTEYWVLTESSCLEQDDSRVVLMQRAET